MGILNTYAELQAGIIALVNDDEADAHVTTAIRLAETEIARRLRLMGDERRARLTLSTDTDGYFALPVSYKSMRSLRVVDPPMSIYYRSPEWMDSNFDVGEVGSPKYWTTVGNDLVLRPVPDSEYVIEMKYMTRKLDILSDSNTTNWLLTDHPDLYLYSAAKHMYMYLEDETQELKYHTLLEGIYRELRIDDEMTRFSGSGLAIRPDSPII